MKRLSGLAPFVLLAAVLATVIAAFWAAPLYSPDTWSYFELAESLESGGYTLNVQRSNGQFATTSPSISFPPLWPAAWRLAIVVTGLGARSGLVLTGLVVLLFAACSELIGRRLTGLRWAGLAAACLVLVTPAYFRDIMGAGTVPPQRLLVAAALVIALRHDRRPLTDGLLLGAVAGLLGLLRFDMLPFAIVLGAGLAWLSRSRQFAAGFAVACLVALSPWIILSRLHYGVWFASDNAGVALSTDPHHFITDWFPPGQAPPSLLERPAAFGWKLLRHAAELVRWVGRDFWNYGGPVLVVGAVLAVLAAHRRLEGGPTGSAWRLLRAWSARGVVAVFTLAALAMIPLYVVTGYYDQRYFSLLVWLLSLWVALGLAAFRYAGFERLSLALSLSLLAGAVICYVPEGRGRRDPGFPTLPGGAELRACLRDPGIAPPSSRVLFLSDADAARMSAVHGIPAAMTPRNFWRVARPAEWTRMFLAQNNLALVSGEPSDLASVFPGVRFEPLPRACGVPLFRLGDSRSANP